MCSLTRSQLVQKMCKSPIELCFEAGVSGITLSMLISSLTSGRAPNCGSRRSGDCEGEGTESRGAGEAGSG